MTLGSGIAIAGVWIFAGLMGLSKTVTGLGLFLSMTLASLVTLTIVGFLN